MALICLEKAAQRLGIPLQSIEIWAKQGLVSIHERSAGDMETGERLVEEDQIHDVAESLGWLFLSSDRWEGAEE